MKQVRDLLTITEYHESCLLDDKMTLKEAVSKLKEKEDYYTDSIEGIKRRRDSSLKRIQSCIDILMGIKARDKIFRKYESQFRDSSYNGEHSIDDASVISLYKDLEKSLERNTKDYEHSLKKEEKDLEFIQNIILKIEWELEKNKEPDDDTEQ